MDEPVIAPPNSRREALEGCIAECWALLKSPTKDARAIAGVSKELRAAYAELDALPAPEEVGTVGDILARREGRTSHLRAVASGEG